MHASPAQREGYLVTMKAFEDCARHVEQNVTNKRIPPL